MKKIIFFLVPIVFIFLIILLFVKNDKTYTTNTYAIWVPRFEYSSIEDVHKIIKNCAELGLTDILFQVRGNGTVYYDSNYEPWAYELFLNNNDYDNPGWNPLEAAIDFSKIYNLKIHAYINVLPGWKGLNDPPISNGNLWSSRKDLFMVDSIGKTMLPTSGWYTFLNPAHPEVISHLRNLSSELLKYDIDGLHLDYIRYPYDYYLSAKEIYPQLSNAELKKRFNFSFDEISISQLNKKYGNNWSDKEIINFKNDTISHLVKSISDSYPSNIIVSASVLANPIDSRLFAGQDSIQWVKKSLVDWIFQMNYNSIKFNDNLYIMTDKLGKKLTKRHLIIGMFCDKSKRELKKEFIKIKKSNCRGYAFFSYGLLFDQHMINSRGALIKSLLSENITQ